MTDLSRPPLSAHPVAAKRPARGEHVANHRATLVRWLRKTHGWFGLWGAVMGLIFGVSGIWLNHRAVMKLPVAQQKTTSQIALSDPVPATPDAMGAWLQQALGLPEAPRRVRVKPAQPVPWAERGGKSDKSEARHDASAARPLMQPEQWTFDFDAAVTQIQVEYWAGNRSASVRQTDNGLLGTLISLHLGRGMTVPWLLLVDTLAGCLIFLSLSGLALWVLTTKRRTVGWTIFGLGSLLAIGLAVARL
ncbi:PepSY-associated TM helix domain-containing protein [Ralstonia pseudosolanacearum]|uniref:Probable transmembrane protein n=1 Tax=Ralstonia nicotianae (strain ATCC BAA-1114 / GMI1000) TaxID=267608 RepID=Q8XUW6_RALN1|nr:PepSY-associated TM helix domain-containing protein [Ralstonia pseudosolanacearum]AST28558.1 peptidase [Ralstonia pseudosolanacearum]MDC6286528.1 PepSY-associated TM helix domain-containing protein [Ralstonia pseudosolanacearum]CAD16776.1 probable transmembrane protein [Ralstonia pseudosolanacearum GMI1000]